MITFLGNTYSFVIWFWNNQVCLLTRKILSFNDEENYTFNSMKKRLYYLLLTIPLGMSFFHFSKMCFR